MNQNSKWPAVFAAIFAAGGVVFVLSRVSFSTGTQAASQPSLYVNTVGAAELESIDSFIEPGSPAEGGRIAEQITDRAFSTPGLFQPVDGRSLPNEQQLRRLISDRIQLIFYPDYEAYAMQVGDLLGRNGHDALRDTMFENEKLWLSFANAYKHAGVAIETTRATLDIGSVTIGESLHGGRQLTFSDPRIYGAASIVENGGTVFSVGIPVMLPPQNTPDAKIMVMYATLSFVWDASRSKWLPCRTAVYDPTGTLGALPPLWL